MNIGHSDLHFMVSWFGLISWRLCDGWKSYCMIMRQCDAPFDLKMNVGHSDLCFMVSWVCLISWRVFDKWTSYFGIMSYCMVQCFCLWHYILYKFCDFGFLYFFHWKHFSFIGKTQLRRATWSCNRTKQQMPSWKLTILLLLQVSKSFGLKWQLVTVLKKEQTDMSCKDGIGTDRHEL